MSATSRNAAAAKGSAPLSGSKSPQSEGRPEAKRYVNSPSVGESRSNSASGYLRTGAHRLAPIPLSLREWVGPENRSKFGDNKSRLHALRGGHR